MSEGKEYLENSWDKILIKLFKNKNDENIEINIYENGEVKIESNIKGNISKKEEKIDFVDELKSQLDLVLPLMKEYYTNSEDLSYKIIYKNNIFYSYDLYIDLYLMVNNNKMRLLSVFKTHEIEQEKQIQMKAIDELNKYELEKNDIELSDVSVDNLPDEINSIVFKLEKNDNFYLGQSRFFSDTIDVSNDIKIPELLEFVGQINLSELNIYDNYNLLPKKGMLYFFQSPFELDGNIYENGKVIFSENMDLVRKKANISKDLIFNYSLFDKKKVVEKFSSRYKNENDKIIYDSFENNNINKIYGFYTDCQMSDLDIKKVSSKYVVLLQLGSDIYGEGVTTYLIEEEDLKNKNFDNVIYKYVQS